MHTAKVVNIEDAERASAKTGNHVQAVEVNGVSFKSGNETLLDGINLSLDPDSITMVMGPNGAGKSLLMRLLHGMLEPASGSVRWGGEPFNELIRQQQAMVFQRPVLLRRSVAANIRYVLKLRGDSADKARIEEVLAAVGLQRLAKRPARLLSGGEQQRLTLARALALKPRVLFLDEPTASLDPASTASIEKIVRTASNNGTKIIFVTHDIGQARRLADDVVFLNRGQLAEHTAATEFFSHPKSTAAKDYLAGRLNLS